MEYNLTYLILRGSIRKVAARLDEDKLEYFRSILLERLKELKEEAERTLSSMTGDRVNLPDPTDRALLESDRNFELRIRDRERQLILKILDALDRIDKGTFGICESCGELIEEERLEARPVTTMCVKCKERQEREEKLRGG